ncbi:MAG: alpha/beta hydrolase [Gammaproteobacteria bacterium]|nr:alpha/beta hydrolase [Gammaproteobacteria bacterium]
MKGKIFVAILFITISGCSIIDQSKRPSARGEVLVFVHGAHLTSNSWLSTEQILKSVGFDAISVNLPGRNSSDKPNEITLNLSSQALCDAIKNIDSPIVLIAHSQGGAISNNAFSICPKKNIKSIIYIAAVAPIDGDTPYSLLSKDDESNYLKGINYDDDSGWMIINNKNLFVSVFTNSESSAIKNKIMSQAVNEPAIIGEGVVHYNSEYFSKLNKFYIHTKFDKIISIESQEKIASKIGLDRSAVLDTGHLPMLSSPALLAREIESILN